MGSQRHTLRWLLRGLLTGLVLLGLPAQSPSAASVPPPVTLVHLFEWKWTDIAKECESYLGPKGFSAVLVSPPNEHARVTSPAYPWWQRYQPVSYQIISRSGTRAEFADMVARCRAVGVQVYADVVINHMAGISGTSIAGTGYTKYNHAGLYSSPDFHWFAPAPDGCQANISNYQDRWNVQHCELVGLADLRTETAYVRTKIADYLVDLYGLGVRGYRIDAAKHIPSADIRVMLDNINARVEPDPFIAQEVIDPGTEAVKKSEYYQNGSVYEFLYGSRLGEKFLNLNGQNIAQLRTFADATSGFAPSGQAVVFVDNHDKQRGHAGGGTYLTYKNGTLYDLSNVFMLAWPYGYPQLMSSYAFDNADAGPPSDASGNTNSIYAAGSTSPSCFSQQPGVGWVCEHRWRPIGNMVAFRSYVASATSVSNWWDNGANQIAFGRGDRGFVAINRESTTLSRTFQTGLAAGTYCDVIHGDFSPAAGACSGPTVEVGATGQATISVGPMSAVAIYGGARLPGPTPSATPTAAPATSTPTRTTTTAPVSGIYVNFQLASAPAHPGYLVDGGAVYGARGNGQTYGWNTAGTSTTRPTPATATPQTRPTSATTRSTTCRRAPARSGSSRCPTAPTACASWRATRSTPIASTTSRPRA